MDEVWSEKRSDKLSNTARTRAYASPFKHLQFRDELTRTRAIGHTPHRSKHLHLHSSLRPPQLDYDKKLPNTFRCVNDCDIISSAVTPWWRGFKHVGVLVHMTDKKLCFDHEAFEMEAEEGSGGFFGDVNAALKSPLLLSCADHLLSNYLEKLELFTVLNKMPAAVAEKCEKAWYELTMPVKARLVATLEVSEPRYRAASRARRANTDGAL